MSKIRLDKFIANQLILPRSEAVKSIRCGRAAVNGETVKQPSYLFDPESAAVCFDGAAVEYKPYVYIILNKPKGVLSASTDKNRKTVIDLVPRYLRRPNIAPVGRLDKDTTGLLIITDDGAFAHECISPKKEVPKRYIVTLDGKIDESAVRSFRNGIVLADGTRCMPADLEKLSENTARVTIFEGKYHQVKRMFGTVGLGVTELHRESIGGLYLPDNLKSGESKEVNLLYLLKTVIDFKQKDI